MHTENYDEFLHQELRDPEIAAEYLTAALEGGSMEEFLLALRNVAEAHGGIGVVAQISRLNRQSMYRMLSNQGNPTVSSLMSVLRVLGIDITFRARKGEAA